MTATATKRGRPRAEHDRKVTKDGYVLVRTEKGWEYEQRVVMARALGRPLRRGERVRWLNGDRTDNRAENLELDDACPRCGASLGFSRRLSEMHGGSRGPRHRTASERPGQARLWRGAP